MNAYFDTSGFVKLFVTEPGREVAETVWRAAGRRLSSRLLYPEARSALSRVVRERRVDEDGALEALRLLELFWESIAVSEVTPRLARRAADLAHEHSLRAYDAVHLASAEAAADEETIVVTADTALRQAARDLGLRTAVI